MPRPELPRPGTRVSIRYRLAGGGLTDVIGHLESVSPAVAVRTKSDGVVEMAPEQIVAARELPYAAVRTSEIRNLEHAAALAWPGVEQQWIGGWLARFGHGVTSRANSAVPLDFSANLTAVPAIADFYRARGLQPWLALPDRVVPVRVPGTTPTRVMVADLADIRAGSATGVSSSPTPDAGWLQTYERNVPLDVLTAVVDGAVSFATVPGAAVGRGAVTTAPDGTAWLGISAVRVAAAHRRRGHARAVCAALADWGRARGASRVYVQVLTDNEPAITLYHEMGFRLHHGQRYLDAHTLLPPTI
ncbi:N-acetylglutamate synthase, CG3035 family [Mycolicibacterium palauense]|uniref:N-acetylglutamate synthase, CG3035 family n=1 Tax=Mycolicibacterium palauense TaxID=2034511 RepID=UPI000BFEE957|nr:GNAT family N-acetyltransferase [Mycolicibacterium palauense]